MPALGATVDFGQLILTRPDLGRESCAPPADLDGTEVESAAPFGCAAGVARRIPGRYRNVTPYSSIIRPLSPSYGHSLDKTARSVWRLGDLTDSRPPPSDDLGRKR